MVTDRLKLFEKIDTALEGCFEIQAKFRGDNRGSFVKTFHEESFSQLGLCTEFKEMFCTTSAKNVLRGLHFQTPPCDHVKLVYCAFGKVMDVAVDLRKKSPTYGKFHVVELDGEKGNMLYLPKGLAHGFLTLSDKAVIVYSLTSVYSPEHDKGILWSSCGIDWKISEPILSERDKKHPHLKDFKSPF